VSWNILQKQIINCNRCPRLRSHCLHVAAEKRAAFREQTYWGKPVPGFGSPDARLLIVGLAPAAHGANRTGRVFTGDRSGDFLFRCLHETGFANQPTSLHREDGLQLIDAVITGVCRCAPPGNKPLPEEIANCAPFLMRTLDLMPNLRGVVALGRIAFEHCLRLYAARGWLPPGKKPTFGHGAAYMFPAGPFLLATFHPSQQNTFTGKLTPPMMRQVFEQAKTLINPPAAS
jgi:uracil-DNA glycosylase family 4